MARTARKTGINAAAWFAAQSFHHSTTITPAPARPALFSPDTDADTQFYAGLLLEAFETRDELIAEADLELELEYRAERDGDACTPNCGYCGRCS